MAKNSIKHTVPSRMRRDAYLEMRYTNPERSIFHDLCLLGSVRGGVPISVYFYTLQNGTKYQESVRKPRAQPYNLRYYLRIEHNFCHSSDINHHHKYAGWIREQDLRDKPCFSGNGGGSVRL